MYKAKTKPKGATSFKETAFGIIPRSKLVHSEIEGTKKGLEYIFDLIQREKVYKITPDLICDLHNVSFGWIFPKWAGKFRKIQVTYSAKEAPPYYQIPELIINLCNGRTARMLTTLILLRLNLPPIELKAETGEDRKRYLKAMQKGDEGYLISLEKLINNALSESLENVKK